MYQMTDSARLAYAVQQHLLFLKQETELDKTFPLNKWGSSEPLWSPL